MTGPIRLEDLPEAILHKIAQYLTPWERRTVLSLVSRGWARLLEGPSPAWEEIEISKKLRLPRLNSHSADLPNSVAMGAWLSRRAGAVRNLRVSLVEDRVEYRSGSGPLLPATLLAAALGTQAHRLRVLYIQMAAISLSSADLNAALRNASNLEEIHLDFCGEHACWDDRGASLLQTLSQLPALQSLSIDSARHWEDHPIMVELAAVSSASLTRLYLHMDSSSGGTLSLGDLPALTDCWLHGCGSEEGSVEEADRVRVTASSFSGAPNLKRLALRHIENIYLAPDCFTSLSSLTDLTLAISGLRVVPSALAGVQGTLESLHLISHLKYPMRVEERGYRILLATPALKRFELRKLYDVTDEVWDVKSVRYLSRFLIEWQALRPGVKLPELIL